jgi:tRNA-specific 2-thiouridylase
MKTVVVGMSGGVDSSVAAYLLQKEGYKVIGLFIRSWDSTLNYDILGNPSLNDHICPEDRDYQDAKEVCLKLDIPLFRVDLIKEYWDYVFTYFLEELKKGRTPNPDIMCNKYIKFDKFIKEAKKLGADLIATGHYARIQDGKLYEGIDKNKDQTYFLSQLTKEQLENVLFPVGSLTKEEVRGIALKINQHIAKKKDSTGICFIGERNFSKFLQNYLPNNPGNIVDIKTNKVLAKHIGLMYYTIGQRRGLNLGGQKDKLYVVGKDLKENILYVASGFNNDYLFSDSALIEEVNFINEKRPREVQARFRYRQKKQAVKLEYLGNNQVLVTYKPIKAVTPGQACVFYEEEECLGGGIIKEVFKKDQPLWYL